MLNKVKWTIYKFNLVCALIMVCALDSDSYIPMIVLAVNLLIVVVPIMRASK